MRTRLRVHVYDVSVLVPGIVSICNIKGCVGGPPFRAMPSTNAASACEVPSAHVLERQG